MHWVYHDLAALSRLVWSKKQAEDSTSSTMPAHFTTKESPFTVASASLSLKHMHHVMNALRQTMLHTALITAWRELEGQLQTASAVARDGSHAALTPVPAVDDLLRLNSAYLDTVEKACWLADDGTSQVWLPAVSKS
jgi:hypothetical protein